MQITVHLHKDELQSVLVSLDGFEAHGVWLPKSQITIEALGLGNRLSIDIPNWLARDKGMVGTINPDQQSLF